MNELKMQFDSFKAIPYPPQGHRDDMELEVIDANIAGAVMEYLSIGHLGDTSLPIIQQNVRQLQEWMPAIPEEAQDYFRTLLKLGVTFISVVS